MLVPKTNAKFLIGQILYLHDLQNCINQIVAACSLFQVEQAIICPGSRNAPLILAFTRFKNITCHSIVDERSAAFVALGMALQLQKPVALVCTSGTALLNFYPAIAEAYYAGVPLLVLSADRPPELLDKWDGQTIRQNAVFCSHVKGSFVTPDSYLDPKVFENIVSQALALAKQAKPGPVHINVPLREPLYPQNPNEAFIYESIELQQDENSLAPLAAVPIDKGILNGKKILILHGFSSKTNMLAAKGLPVLADVLSNIEGCETLNENLFVGADTDTLLDVKPEVLLSSGSFMLSKNVKQFLRNYKPQLHYHFSEDGDMADAYDTDPILIRQNLNVWLQQTNLDSNKSYLELLQKQSQAADETDAQFFGLTLAFNEFFAVKRVLEKIPDAGNLHLGNSMPVRYAALCGAVRKKLRIFGNRGTSGIDGSMSTAVGFSALSAVFNTLLIGDVSFFYDSNAFWNDLPKHTLRIVLLNNNGGGIFRMLDGSSTLPELETWLETKHQRNAALFCQEFGLEYSHVTNSETLDEALQYFWQTSEQPKLLEIKTDSKINSEIFKLYKSKHKKTHV